MKRLAATNVVALWPHKQGRGPRRQLLVPHGDNCTSPSVDLLISYSELRAFDRAFKRWANITPREWREQNGSS